MEELVRKAAERGLSEIVLRESIGGWQAIAKFHGALMGPWNVGCSVDPREALRVALAGKLERAPVPQEDVFG